MLYLYNSFLFGSTSTSFDPPVEDLSSDDSFEFFSSISMIALYCDNVMIFA